MVRQVATRSQRRLVKKQTALLLALVLVASLISFTLGMMVGRGSFRGDVAVVVPPPARQPLTQPPPPPPAAAGARPTESLTFYDSLPKGDQPPLGSGINLPPAKSPPPAATPPAEPATFAPPAAEVPEATAPVVEAPPPAKPAAPAPQKTAAAPAAKAAPAAPAPAAGGYLVQAAAFRRNEDARALQAKLSKKGYAAFTEEVQLGKKGVWYRVYVGPFAAAGAADAAVSRLKAEEKLSALVRKR